MIGDFFAASREVGVRPFLMWGTLLGLVREGGLMKHDTDVDVCLMSGDYPRKAELAAAMHRRGYGLIRDEPYKLRFARDNQVLHLDIDVLYSWEGKLLTSAVSSSGEFRGLWFEPSLFATLREVDFLKGLRVLIPSKPELVLKTIYGRWQTPDPSYDSGAKPANHLSLAPTQPFPEFILAPVPEVEEPQFHKW